MAFNESYPGVGIYGQYCLVTGRMIGSSLEMDDLIRTLAGMDPEEAADDIAIRIFAAMRPSIFWNKTAIDSVAKMQETRPVDVLAWLLNRMLTPPNYRGSFVAIHHDRIKTYQWAAELDADWRELMMNRMINLDSRLSLSAQLFDGGFDALSIETLDDWLTQGEKAADKREKDMEMQTRWYRDGNTQSRAAKVESFFKKVAATPAKKAETEKTQTLNMMGSLLSTLMDGTATPESRSVSTPPIPAKPVAATPKSTGLSFLKKKAQG